jgi:hypothetical protein
MLKIQVSEDIPQTLGNPEESTLCELWQRWSGLKWKDSSGAVCAYRKGLLCGSEGRARNNTVQ